MLVTSRDTGRWVLPKGWPEFGEQFCDAAAREAGEEAGLKGAISSQEAGRYYYSKGLADGDNVRCEVLVYPLEVDDVADKWKEKGERKRKWVSPAKAAEMVAEADLGKVILAFAGKPTPRRRVAACRASWDAGRSHFVHRLVGPDFDSPRRRIGVSFPVGRLGWVLVWRRRQCSLLRCCRQRLMPTPMTLSSRRFWNITPTISFRPTMR